MPTCALYSISYCIKRASPGIEPGPPAPKAGILPLNYKAFVFKLPYPSFLLLLFFCFPSFSCFTSSSLPLSPFLHKNARGGVRTHASEENSTLNCRLGPLGHPCSLPLLFFRSLPHSFFLVFLLFSLSYYSFLCFPVVLCSVCYLPSFLYLFPLLSCTLFLSTLTFTYSFANKILEGLCGSRTHDLSLTRRTLCQLC